MWIPSWLDALIAGSSLILDLPATLATTTLWRATESSSHCVERTSHSNTCMLTVGCSSVPALATSIATRATTSRTGVDRPLCALSERHLSGGGLWNLLYYMYMYGWDINLEPAPVLWDEVGPATGAYVLKPSCQVQLHSTAGTDSELAQSWTHATARRGGARA
eukprot:scaffold40_cov413-Prasinococcus_capsulatus_cf.AAC.7